MTDQVEILCGDIRTERGQVWTCQHPAGHTGPHGADEGRRMTVVVGDALSALRDQRNPQLGMAGPGHAQDRFFTGRLSGRVWPARQDA